MGKQYPAIEPAHADFMGRQHVFFTASAAPGAKINLSPREIGALRLLGPNAVVYLDRTGSGNETAAHLAADGRLTIMFCAFEGPPMIMRLYGRGRVIRRGGDEYATLLAGPFGGAEPSGARQMVHLAVEMVQTSCGFGVPLFEYEGERPSLDRWTEAKGPEGIAAYWREKNLVSLDGLPTGLLDETPADA